MKRIFYLLFSVIVLVSMTAASFTALSFGAESENYTLMAGAKYTDVPQNHWAYSAIQRASENNWFSGYPDGSFLPNGKITRAEAVKVFVVFSGITPETTAKSSFGDVSANKWYAPYVEAGKDLLPAYVDAQGKEYFKPDTPITREDTVYALINTLGYQVGGENVNEAVLDVFSDKNDIYSELRGYFAVAIEKKLVSGFPDGTVRPQNSLTRAEFATLLGKGYDLRYNENTNNPNNPNTPDTPDPADSYQEQVLNLVNEVRAENGLSKLSMDSLLTSTAQEKAADMKRINYFNHNSPTYGSPFDMMNDFGVDFRSAGENIAKGQRTPEEVMEDWMNSPGHRANILTESFTHLGVGYVPEDNIWVQMFIGVR